MRPGKWVLGLFAAGFVVALAVVAWRQWPASAPPVGLAVPAQPAPTVKHTPKRSVPIKGGQVRVYAPEAKARLSMPWLKDDPAKQVLAAHQVPADDHPQTVTTVIDTGTGDSQTYVTRDPLPWFAWDMRGEAGIYAGLKNGEPAVRLEVRQGVFQIKALHFGGIGSVDMSRSPAAGAVPRDTVHSGHISPAGQPLAGPIGADWFIGAGVWASW